MGNIYAAEDSNNPLGKEGVKGEYEDIIKQQQESGKNSKTKYTIELQEQIGDTKKIEAKSGFDLFTKYISLLYKYGASIIGLICVLVIVVSGVQISMGGVNQENVSNARNRIFQALLSMLLLFMSAAILHAINPNFFQ